MRVVRPRRRPCPTRRPRCRSASRHWNERMAWSCSNARREASAQRRRDDSSCDMSSSCCSPRRRRGRPRRSGRPPTRTGPHRYLRHGGRGLRRRRTAVRRHRVRTRVRGRRGRAVCAAATAALAGPRSRRRVQLLGPAGQHLVRGATHRRREPSHIDSIGRRPTRARRAARAPPRRPCQRATCRAPRGAVHPDLTTDADVRRHRASSRIRPAFRQRRNCGLRGGARLCCGGTRHRARPDGPRSDAPG